MEDFQRKANELLNRVEKEAEPLPAPDLDEEAQEEEDKEEPPPIVDDEGDLKSKVEKILTRVEETKRETKPEAEAEEPEPKEQKNDIEEKLLKLLKKTETEPEGGPEHTLTIIIKKPDAVFETEMKDNVIITDEETDLSGNFITSKVTKLNLEEDPTKKKYKIKVENE
jgi:hypothetical protein